MGRSLKQNVDTAKSKANDLRVYLEGQIERRDIQFEGLTCGATLSEKGASIFTSIQAFKVAKHYVELALGALDRATATQQK